MNKQIVILLYNGISLRNKQFSLSAVTKYHRLGGLKNRNLLFRVLEAGKEVQIKVLIALLPDEDSSWFADGSLVSSHDGKTGSDSSLVFPLPSFFVEV